MEHKTQNAPGPVRPWHKRRSRRSWALAMLALAVLAVGSPSILHRFSAARGPDASRAIPPPSSSPPPAVPAMRLAAIAPADARAVNAARPFADVANPPAPPFVYGGPDLARARDCLAAAAWWEAGDDTPGEAAVVQVVLNRLRHPAFPKTVCGVIWQGAERGAGCQFTFACDGSLDTRRPSPAAWLRAQGVAQGALAGRVMRAVGLATHYHTDAVLPVWSASMLKVAAEGPHLFFRWPGYWGERSAWRRVAPGDEPAVAALAPFSPAHAVAAPSPPAAKSAAQGTLADAGLGANYPREALDARARQAAPTPNGAPGATSFELPLAPDPTGGGWALQALALCRGKPVCTVTGHLPGAQGPPAFVYRRTPAGDAARWNCAAVHRPAPDQCLPDAAR